MLTPLPLQKPGMCGPMSYARAYLEKCSLGQRRSGNVSNYAILMTPSQYTNLCIGTLLFTSIPIAFTEPQDASILRNHTVPEIFLWLWDGIIQITWMIPTGIWACANNHPLNHKQAYFKRHSRCFTSSCLALEDKVVLVEEMVVLGQICKVLKNGSSTLQLPEQRWSQRPPQRSS